MQRLTEMFFRNENAVLSITIGYACKKYYFILLTMKKYTKVKVIKITEIQHNTLLKMDSYQINVAQFIRDAIAEKIKREYKDLLPNPKKQYCPFSGGTIEI